MKTYEIYVCPECEWVGSIDYRSCPTHPRRVVNPIEVTPTPPKPDECTCDPESIFADVDCPIHDPPPKPDEPVIRRDNWQDTISDLEAALQQAEKMGLRYHAQALEAAEKQDELDAALQQAEKERDNWMRDWKRADLGRRQAEKERDELKRINEFDIHVALAEANEHTRQAESQARELREALEEIEVHAAERPSEYCQRVIGETAHAALAGETE